MARQEAKEMAPVADEETAMIVAGDFEAEAGQGFEEMDADSYAIPMLNILQSGSPQCKRSDGAYIEGAQEGMLLDSATQVMYDGDEGVVAIPVHFRRSFVEWRPREGGGGGGGFAGEHSVEAALELLPRCTTNDKGQSVLPNGNLLVDTRTHYIVLRTPAGHLRPMVIAMASTQLKKSKRWNTMMDNVVGKRADGSTFKPPTYAMTYRLTTVPESNDQGSWYGWAIAPAGPVKFGSPEYQAAKEFREAVTSGKAQVQHAAAEQTSSGTTVDQDIPEDAVASDDIPF